MNIFTTILIEFLLIASCILALFRFRNKLGLAPLYILVGAIQYIQVFSSSNVNFEILGTYTIYPVSVIIFSAVLFAVLLIYIKEGVASARTLILGIILTNFILSALTMVTYIQGNFLGMVSEELAQSISIIDYKFFAIGTLILLVDFILLVITYQFLISKVNKLNLFLVLFISLEAILVFDALAFNFILRFGDPTFANALIGHIIGKSVAAFVFSSILYIYLKYIDAEHENASFIANQDRDVFSIITYKKKYLDLKVEKEEVEQKFTHKLESTLNNISDGFVALDRNWRYTYLNGKSCEFLGKSLENLIGQNIWDVFPDAVEQPVYKAYHKAVETQQTQVFEDYYQPLDKWFENRVYPSSEGLSIFFSDITEKKKAEELLINSEKSLDSFVNNLGDPLFVKDDQSRLILVNDAFCDLFSLSREQILGKTLAEDLPSEEMEIFFKIDAEVLSTGIENINEESLTIRDEETRIISTKKTRFIDDQGNKYLIGLIRDISERKKAEIELKTAKEFSDKLIMSMQEGLIIVNLEGEIIMVNDSFCEIVGYSSEELIGLNLPYPFAITDEVDSIRSTIQQIENGKRLSWEFEFIRKNKEKFKASFSTGNIKNDKGEVIAVFGTMKDISEEEKVKKLLEENAIKSNLRKNTIIDLTTLVGQDFNESLSRITSLAAKTLNVDRVSVWEFNEEKTENYCKKLYNLNSDSFSNGLVLKRVDHPQYFKQLEEKSIVSVNDAVDNALTKTMAEDYLIPNNITSKISIAINGLDGLFGIICFERVGYTKSWDHDEEEFAISIANVVSLMIEITERKLSESKIEMANEQLRVANKELNALRDQLEQENVYLREELDLVFNYEDMVYGSSEFSDVLTEVEKVAPTDATVLLLGESGTGKELLARAIYNTSERNNKPLIKVNCSAIPRELIESEFFGHKKGSFTGAINDKVGKFELADGGTLFLDEIGELPLDMQPKLLRFLQEGEIEVVGGTGSKKLDVRIIAATNKNLKEEIEKNNFREDLYFRLNVFPIEIPPLRNRKDDIPLLVEHFIDKFNKSYAKNIKYITDDTMHQLRSYEWPGNIRELENLIERAVILSTNETLVIPGFESKNQKLRSEINNNSLSFYHAQRHHILHVLEQCNWKISGPDGAAILLDLKPSTLRDKMSKLNIIKPLIK